MATVTKVEKSSDVSSEVGKTDSRSMRYISNIQPKQLIVQRSIAPTGRQYSSQYSRDTSSRNGAISIINPSTYVSIASQGVIAVQDSREKEKKDMEDLNERLANYIEKARFLEARNRKLDEDLKRLKDKWSSDEDYGKEMYEKELKEARKQLEEANIEKHKFQVELDNSLQEFKELKVNYGVAVKELEEKIDEISRYMEELANANGELSLLRNKQEAFDRDREKDKTQLNKLQELLIIARADLYNQTNLLINAENKWHTLEEDLAFHKLLHEQEIKKARTFNYQNESDLRSYWTSHMGPAIRDIQEAYNNQLAATRAELEFYYNFKLQEYEAGTTKVNIQTDNYTEDSKRLREQMGPLREQLNEQESRVAHLTRELELLKRERDERERDLEQRNGELTQECVLLRAQMEAMIREMDSRVRESKPGLGMHIAAYRTLLEGEESRSGLRQIVDSSSDVSIRQIEQTSGDSSTVSQIVKGQMNAKTKYTKSAKGPVGIFECGNDGKYVALENTGRKDESLDGWSVVRNIDTKDFASYKFKEGYVLKASEKIKIWSQGKKPADAAAGDLEADKDWGVGANITTTLFSPSGEDRANHKQTTTFSS